MTEKEHGSVAMGDSREALVEALRRQSDNMAFIINHATLPDQWMDKFSRELTEDRAALAARPVQEPVAWLRVARMTPITGEEYNSLWLTNEEDERGFPVYRDPPCDPAPSQEPVCTVSVIGAGGHRWLTPHPLNALDALPIGTPLYAAPQPTHGTSATERAPEAHPMAKFGSPTVAPLGLYRVHWKSGGSSLAAIGMMENGDRWIAPTNWITPGTIPSAGEWGEIERLQPIDVDPQEHPAKAGQGVEAELAAIRKSVRNAMGAIESNQVADKDVHGTLKGVLKRLDALVTPTPKEESK